VGRSSPSTAPEGEVSARTGEPTDADLLCRHLQGEPDAFSSLFRRHKQELWAVTIRLLGDAGLAAEAIQDAMILAFWNGPEFGGGDAITTWLYRIVVSVCVDRMRRCPPPAGDGDVMAALRHLAVEQQSALVLVDMLGFSIADAAAILGVSADTLLSRCARGRARLLTELRSTYARAHIR
jgi:RNA polymerase sigma-70 factor, ECF subfamily